MYCYKCGCQLPNDARFCAKCGAHQNYGVKTAMRSEPKAQPQLIYAPMAQKGNRVLLASILAVCTVIAVVLIRALTVTAVSDEEQARAVVQRYFDAVQAGDTNGALECFTPAEQEQYNGALKFGGMLNSFLGLTDVSGIFNSVVGMADAYTYENYEFQAENVSLDAEKKHGSVTVKVYVDGALNEVTSMNVVKYNGEWYVE